MDANKKDDIFDIKDFQDVVGRVISLVSNNNINFKSQPRANRFDAILELLVPTRKNPTVDKILVLVNALIESKAIRQDEGGLMYSALLQRVSKYNSMNVQTNLDRLATDVKEAIAQKERVSNSNTLGSLVALNGFISSLPSTVERGQQNYVAFLSALRLMVTEAPQSEVYRSGPNYYFQSSRNGLQTVNLTKAFENLSNLWGVKAPIYGRSPTSALLTPNTRLLLLLIAPFTDSVSLSRESYLGHLLTLYRETIGNTRINEITYDEINDVSKALGNGDTQNLQDTLNFLLTNRKQKAPEEYILTNAEEKILRYIQQSIALYLMQDGYSSEKALDMTSSNLAPSFYSENRDFINKLMDYFHRAASMAPEYFTKSILNPNWLPPSGFFTGDYDFPELDDGLMWDDIDSGLITKQTRANTPISLISTPSAPRSLENYNVSYDSIVRQNNSNVLEKNLRNNSVDQLVDKMKRWKTYAKEREEFVENSRKRDRSPIRGPRKKRGQRNDDLEYENDEEDGMGDYLFTGTGNPFLHLKPKGYF